MYVVVFHCSRETQVLYLLCGVVGRGNSLNGRMRIVRIVYWVVNNELLGEIINVQGFAAVPILASAELCLK